MKTLRELKSTKNSNRNELVQSIKHLQQAVQKSGLRSDIQKVVRQVRILSRRNISFMEDLPPSTLWPAKPPPALPDCGEKKNNRRWLWCLGMAALVLGVPLSLYCGIGVMTSEIKLEPWQGLGMLIFMRIFLCVMGGVFIGMGVCFVGMIKQELQIVKEKYRL
jgi:hypothetical protein